MAFRSQRERSFPMFVRVLSLSIRCIVAARPRPVECVRLVSLAALAAIALREESPASRMWLGQLRAGFRRAMAVRCAVESSIPCTPWLDLLGHNAIGVSALAGVAAALAVFFAARG